MYILKSPTVKLKLQKLWEISFSVFLKCAEKHNFKELTILILNVFLIGGVPTNEFLIRIQLVPLDKQSCAFSSSNLFCEKSFLTLNFKFLQILILQTARSILNTVVCTAYFSDNFNRVFSKRNKETFLCLCSVVCKKREQIGYLEHCLQITKTHYISH